MSRSRRYQKDEGYQETPRTTFEGHRPRRNGTSKGPIENPPPLEQSEAKREK
ncbi:MAG: hypothetical protein ACXWR1_08670 [Bdellovibrionota bacterium]